MCRKKADHIFYELFLHIATKFKWILAKLKISHDYIFLLFFSIYPYRIFQSLFMSKYSCIHMGMESVTRCSFIKYYCVLFYIIKCGMHGSIPQNLWNIRRGICSCMIKYFLIMCFVINFFHWKSDFVFCSRQIWSATTRSEKLLKFFK